MPSDFRISYPNTIENYREASKMLSQKLAGAIFEGELPEMGPDFFETLFRPALDIAEERDIPLYCGEYGVIDLADNDSKIRWAADICAVFDKYGIGRAYWNYKRKGLRHCRYSGRGCAERTGCEAVRIFWETLNKACA
mgnify:CR=1 FL=1